MKDAISAAINAVHGGAAYYLRSDIHNFFTCIKRDQVSELLLTLTKDKEFCEFFRNAIAIELMNLAALGAKARYFPIDDGMAQGCCLSPFCGNLVLRDFDEATNGRGITCIRYIDDFIILGPNRKSVLKVFETARAILEGHGMQAYDPGEEPKKAEEGRVDEGFGFLGCKVTQKSILPDQESLVSLYKKIDDRLKLGPITPNRVPRIQRKSPNDLLPILSDVNHILSGWAHAYLFCTPGPFWDRIDRKVSNRITTFFRVYVQSLDFEDAGKLRTQLGISHIGDLQFRSLL